MGVVTARLEDGLHQRLKERVGERSVSAFVVEAIEAALGEGKVVAEVVGPPVRLGGVTIEGTDYGVAVIHHDTKPRDEAKIARIKAYIAAFPGGATAEGQPEDLKGYLCSATVPGGQCSRPAFRWVGRLARCEEH